MDKRSQFKEIVFNCLIALIWTQNILIRYVRAVITAFPFIGGSADLIIGLLYASVIILALSYFKFSKGDLAFVLAVSTVFILEYLFYKPGEEYLNHYFTEFLLGAFPLYFVGINLSDSNNKQQLFHVLYVLSMITLAANILYRFMFGTPMSEIASMYEGDMYLAYNLLPHCCFIAYNSFRKPSFINVLFTVAGGFYLLMLGTRGAAIIYLLNIATHFIFLQAKKSRLIKIIIIFCATAAFAISPLFNKFILWMYKQAEVLGLSVRIFDKMISGDTLSSGGRDNIREALFAAIKENPVLGYGLCSDRVIAGSYAHNIVIELWVDFGVFIGTALFIAMAVIILRGLLNCKDTYEKGFIISLIFASVFKLFLSGSYLDEKLLFLLLGMCVYNARKIHSDIAGSAVSQPEINSAST